MIEFARSSNGPAKLESADLEPTTKSHSLVAFALVLLGVLALFGLFALTQPWKYELRFDDAYMFTRYIRNVKDGFGISWNSDRVPTFGTTSLPWLLVVAPFTYFLRSEAALRAASMLCSLVALVVMSWTVVCNSRSKLLSSPLGAVLLVSVPLLLSSAYRFLAVSGMETSLGIVANAALVGIALAWKRNPSRSSAICMAVAAFCAVTVRPESVICALLVPTMAWWSSRDTRGKRELLLVTGLPLLLLTVLLAGCDFYFGSPVPLSFYAKSTHLYEGFTNPENSGQYLSLFFETLWLQLSLIFLLGTDKNLKRFAPFYLPFGLTIAYLLTVHQIMGASSRFYMPYIPYVVIPALLTLDDWLVAKSNNSLGSAWITKIVAVAFVVLLIDANDVYRKATWSVVPRPKLAIQATRSLPARDWFATIKGLSRVVSEGMGAHGVIAASEVGYLGDSLPNVNIIDLVGLNNRTIARNGFSMNYVLAQKPELIWFPHWDYTGLNAKILSDPDLYKQYVVIAQAYNYGIAIRKNGPHRDAIMASLKREWPTLYPHFEMSQYVVKPPSSPTAAKPPAASRHGRVAA